VNSIPGGLTGVGGQCTPPHAVRNLGWQQAKTNHGHDQDNPAGSSEQLDAVDSDVAATGRGLPRCKLSSTANSFNASESRSFSPRSS